MQVMVFSLCIEIRVQITCIHSYFGSHLKSTCVCIKPLDLYIFIRIDYQLQNNMMCVYTCPVFTLQNNKYIAVFSL